MNNVKVERKYLIQYLVKNKWQFSDSKENKKGFRKPSDARISLDSVMTHHNDFVEKHYRLIERTKITIDSPLDKIQKEW